MGWLGWTEPQAMDADVNSILLAMEGKLEMMYPEIAQKRRKENSFAARFKNFAKDHNIKIKAAKLAAAAKTKGLSNG